MTTRSDAPPTGAGLANAETLAALLGERALNLRQVLSRAHRGMNRLIAEKFAGRGYADIRPEHLTVLANMNLGETSIAELAERAQMTTAGVSQLAADLVRLGHVQKAAHGAESTSAPLLFTDQGWELMLTSFNIQREIESEFRDKLQEGDLDRLRRILGEMFGES